MPLECQGVSPSLFFLFTPFLQSFSSSSMGSLGQCLSYQHLPPVVGSGWKDIEIWPCQTQGIECNNDSLFHRRFCFSIIFSCFRAFPVVQNDMECRYWSYVASFTIGYIHSRRILHGRGGIFPRAGPLAQCRHRYGPISLLPPTLAKSPLFQLICFIY